MNNSNTAVDQFDQRLVKALRHPIREAALTMLADRKASPKEIAEAIDESVQNVDYHVKELVRMECAELVETVKVRNADQHFYKATIRHFFDPEEWPHVPEHDRHQMRIDLIKRISGEASEAAKAKTLDTADNHMSRSPINVDKQGWVEIHDRLDETLEQIMTIREKAVLRMSASGEEPIEARVGLIQFALPNGSR